MSLIRYRQPIVTRLFPQQGNRQFMVPNVPPLGPELIPDPYFKLWAGLPQPDDFPLGWVLSGNAAGRYFEDNNGCRLISPDTASPALRLNAVLEVGALYTHVYRIGARASGGYVSDVGWVVFLDAAVGVLTTVVDVEALGTDFRLAPAGTPNDVTLDYWSVRKQQSK